MLIKILIFLSLLVALVSTAYSDSKSFYTGEKIEKYDGFNIVNRKYKMSDGVFVSVSLWIPHKVDEKYPVLLEMSPYRKDDLFLDRDFSLNYFFVKRGFILAKADVRGTGSSTGPVPTREYSKKEIEDGVELIKILSQLPEGNGSVGMWGISWSGFNAVQVAMKNPPGLKAILAAHATDDLYKDDVHYVDGIFHMDEYMLDMSHEVALPKTPDYKFDEDYFKNRFESYPWVLTYLHQQLDGPFWRDHSLKNQYEKIKVPVFLIGGQLDTYRDFLPRFLKKAKVPVKAIMGPYIHTWPDLGEPGPLYEWREEAIHFWNQWLRVSKDKGTKQSGQSKQSGQLEQTKQSVPSKHMRTFVRDYYQPDTKIENLPGFWCQHIDETVTENRKYFLLENKLALKPSEKPKEISTDYVPGEGFDLGFYWGELTGPMDQNEKGIVAFVSEPFKDKNFFVGIPEVSFEAHLNDAFLHWIVRLEDVAPSGEISFVTGAALNGSQISDRLKPKIYRNEKVLVNLQLHFSSWVFQPGHRLRMSISHSAHPMLWPTPTLGSADIILNKNSFIEIPVLKKPCQQMVAPKVVEDRVSHPAVKDFDTVVGDWPANLKREVQDGKVIISAQGSFDTMVKGWRIKMNESASHSVLVQAPKDAEYSGIISHEFSPTEVDSNKSSFILTTSIRIRSDESDFYVDVERLLDYNGGSTKKKRWSEKIKRQFQ